jgi:hypothetical protein
MSNIHAHCIRVGFDVNIEVGWILIIDHMNVETIFPHLWLELWSLYQRCAACGAGSPIPKTPRTSKPLPITVVVVMFLDLRLH